MKNNNPSSLDTTEFKALGLNETLLHTILNVGYTKPTPIQIEAIPGILSERDVMAMAQTGTGKTAGFTLPIVQLLSLSQKAKAKYIRALIVAPTRELAAQVAQNVERYSNGQNLSTCAVFGGVRIEPQIFQLSQGVDILIATPGRLLDLYKQQSVYFDDLEILVLDEADRMLELGFIDDIRYLQTLLPKIHQTLLFSATFSNPIKALAKSMLTKPLIIEVATLKTDIQHIEQRLIHVDKSRKTALLIYLIQHYQWHQVLVFCRTKRGADELVAQLEAIGLCADSIHANRTQRARTLALAGFKNGSLQILVATDIAARGIDVLELPCVINFDLPFVPEDYVHRIGRTGRAGAKGIAISFYSDDETKQLKAIEKSLNKTLEVENIAGFEPSPAPVKLEPVVEEDLYGNFEANDTLPRKRNSKNRGKRGRRK